jgi:hypothetical protein
VVADPQGHVSDTRPKRTRPLILLGSRSGAVLARVGDIGFEPVTLLSGPALTCGIRVLLEGRVRQDESASPPFVAALL